MIKIVFVCLGNICRSPMAEFIFKDLVKKNNLEKDFIIDSKATSEYNYINHISIYPETKRILKANNIPFIDRVSIPLKKDDYDKYDYIIAMDDSNINNIFKIITSDPQNKVSKLLDFTSTPKDVIDPWYYGNFEQTYKDISYGCQSLLNYLLNKK